MKRASERREVLETVAGRLVRFRSQEGLPVDEAARKAGIETERLIAAEAAELALSEAELEALAELYGIGLTQFFGGRVTPFEYLLGF